MKKLSPDTENSIVSMTKSGCSTRTIAEKLKISQSVVVKVQKRQNVCSESVLNGRRRLLTDSDARLMMSNMKKDKLLTPKEASKELNKTVSRWTARRALGRIGYIASVKKINQLYPRKMLELGYNLQRRTRTGL